MFSLFVGRVANARAVPALAAARTPTSTSTLQAFTARRTFLTTVPLREPTKAKQTTTKPTAAKSKTTTKAATTKAATTKKANATEKVAPKKAAPKKKVAAKQPAKAKKPKKVAPPKVTITTQDMPPKEPLTPWIIFAQRFRAGRPTPKDLPEAQQILRDASGAWKALTEHEKQAFRDENAVLRAEYVKAREAYFETVDPAKLQLLNKRRKKAGKPRIKLPAPKERRPLTPFFRFLAEHRVVDGPGSTVEKAKASGAIWRALPDDEKKSYTDAYHKELAAYKAKQNVPVS